MNRGVVSSPCRNEDVKTCAKKEDAILDDSVQAVVGMFDYTFFFESARYYLNPAWYLATDVVYDETSEPGRWDLKADRSYVVENAEAGKEFQMWRRSS